MRPSTILCAFMAATVSAQFDAATTMKTYYQPSNTTATITTSATPASSVSGFPTTAPNATTIHTGAPTQPPNPVPTGGAGSVMSSQIWAGLAAAAVFAAVELS